MRAKGRQRGGCKINKHITVAIQSLLLIISAHQYINKIIV